MYTPWTRVKQRISQSRWQHNDGIFLNEVSAITVPKGALKGHGSRVGVGRFPLMHRISSDSGWNIFGFLTDDPFAIPLAPSLNWCECAWIWHPHAYTMPLDFIINPQIFLSYWDIFSWETMYPHCINRRIYFSGLTSLCSRLYRISNHTKRLHPHTHKIPSQAVSLAARE